MTFKDSSWLMSIVVPHPPHFAGQPEDVFTLWGYGLFIDNKGDYIDKPMAQASGQVIPEGAKNFALLGQYVEIPEDVVFTVEYSVRDAMYGVYGLLGLKTEIPPIYHGMTDPKVALAGLRTLMG